MIDEKYRPVMFANGLKTQTFICRTLFIYIYIYINVRCNLLRSLLCFICVFVLWTCKFQPELTSPSTYNLLKQNETQM